MIIVKNIFFSYKPSRTIKKSTYNLFEDLSFSLPASGIVGLIGRNGSGKTTLFDLISKHLKPQGGEIHIPSGKSILLLGQNMRFPHRMTVLEAIEFTFLLNNLNPIISLEKFYKIIGEKGVHRWENIKAKQVNHLSTGENKWLCVCISLCLDRDIYLLDEPTDGVDPEFRYEIWQIIKKEEQVSKKLFIISSHLLTEMSHYVEDIYFLNKGKCEYFKNIDYFCSSYESSHPDEAFVKAHQSNHS